MLIGGVSVDKSRIGGLGRISDGGGQSGEAIKSAKQQNRSLWRVSSTLFAHIASDSILKPLVHFAEFPVATNYPSTSVGEFVELELAVINLKGKAEVKAFPLPCMRSKHEKTF
ncbi:hypothetical protein IFM89_013716 [Coptis chinensis]|uniref:Uncharacterized protein n=1 Tax=Coptis chinensis TaxID=261450 RepID=A0A835HUK6_9MAGN|nr:hypothetical protein IFM89_013716 [Coptis chinensis]